MERLTLTEYLLIAETILGADALELLYVTKTGLAESALEAPFASWGGAEFYPDVATKAAILCSRLVSNHPLPDGNKRTAYVAMRAFLTLNGADWHGPADDEVAEIIEHLAGEPPPMDEADFIDWVRDHVHY